MLQTAPAIPEWESRECIKCKQTLARDQFYTSSIKRRIHICKPCILSKWDHSPGYKLRKNFMARNKQRIYKISQKTADDVAERCNGISELSGKGGVLMMVCFKDSSERKFLAEDSLVIINNKDRKRWNMYNSSEQRDQVRYMREIRRAASQPSRLPSRIELCERLQRRLQQAANIEHNQAIVTIRTSPRTKCTPTPSPKQAKTESPFHRSPSPVSPSPPPPLSPSPVPQFQSQPPIQRPMGLCIDTEDDNRAFNLLLSKII
jgi:hypothetical protein